MEKIELELSERQMLVLRERTDILTIPVDELVRRILDEWIDRPVQLQPFMPPPISYLRDSNGNPY